MIKNRRPLAVTRKTRHFQSAGCSPPQTQADSRRDTRDAISSRSSRQPHFSLQEGGASSPGHSPPDWSDPSRDSPGSLPLERPTVGRATPTLLGGVPIGGVCGSAHHLTSGHVCNGDRVESEMGWVRRPLLADWLKRDAMPVRLRPRVRLLASAQRMQSVVV